MWPMVDGDECRLRDTINLYALAFRCLHGIHEGLRARFDLYDKVYESDREIQSMPAENQIDLQATQ